MPTKIKELVRNLEIAGFVNRGSKVVIESMSTQTAATLLFPGSSSDDAKPYQIRETKKKIMESK